LLVKTNTPYQPVHYDIAPNYFEAFWLEQIGRLGGATLWKLVTVALLSTLIILGVMDEAGSPENVASLSRIAPYGLIGTAAYVILFTLAAGYIHTAYQVNHAPFAVYLSALPGAGAIYVRCSLARHLPSQITGHIELLFPVGLRRRQAEPFWSGLFWWRWSSHG
jgi:hypothetical protein